MITSAPLFLDRLVLAPEPFEIPREADEKLAAISR
jgi:hypothetical protein